MPQYPVRAAADRVSSLTVMNPPERLVELVGIVCEEEVRHVRETYQAEKYAFIAHFADLVSESFKARAESLIMDIERERRETNPVKLLENPKNVALRRELARLETLKTTMKGEIENWENASGRANSMAKKEQEAIDKAAKADVDPALLAAFEDASFPVLERFEDQVKRMVVQVDSIHDSLVRRKRRLANVDAERRVLSKSMHVSAHFDAKDGKSLIRGFMKSGK